MEDFAIQYPVQASLLEVINSPDGLILDLEDSVENTKPEKMLPKRQNFMAYHLGILKLKLDLNSTLQYLKFYRVLAPEQIIQIKGAPDHSKSCDLLVECLKSCPNIAYERLCHAFILTSQICLYLFFRDLADLDQLEVMARSHVQLVRSNLHNKIKSVSEQPFEMSSAFEGEKLGESRHFCCPNVGDIKRGCGPMKKFENLDIKCLKKG